MIPFQELKLLENGLIPVIVQAHDTKAVLMQAYMNQEAYEKTMETGRMHYYSRSRGCLWLKGETSGPFPGCGGAVRGLRLGLYSRGGAAGQDLPAIPAVTAAFSIGLPE